MSNYNFLRIKTVFTNAQGLDSQGCSMDHKSHLLIQANTKSMSDGQTKEVILIGQSSLFKQTTDLTMNLVLARLMCVTFATVGPTNE